MHAGRQRWVTFQIAETFQGKVIDYSKRQYSAGIRADGRNDAVIKGDEKGRIRQHQQVVRGEALESESISMMGMLLKSSLNCFNEKQSALLNFGKPVL